MKSKNSAAKKTRLLEDKVAIVTGGGKGIGAHYCTALAAEGARIIVADIVKTENTVKTITDRGGVAVGVTCDVTDPYTVETVVRDAMNRFGSIDILVNNAALFAELHQKSFLEIDDSEWDRVMQVNVRGPFTLAKAVVPKMKKGAYGRIINIASGTVFKGTPLFLHYVSSKGAQIAFTRALSREVGQFGITVNCLAPGLTLSESVTANKQFSENQAGNYKTRALKREEFPEDLAGAIVFLSSEKSSFITGQTLVIDGGSVMW